MAALRLYLLLFYSSVSSYTVICPHASHRHIRANAVCSARASDKYSCLFDTNKKVYKEYCNETDYSAPGEKYVMTGSHRNVECSQNRYQPYALWSNESSQCLIQKSLCLAEGQVVYHNGSTIADISCRCDYSFGYDFVMKPPNRCYCKPSEEDCSCYLRKCINGSYLDTDYNCTYPGTDTSYFCSEIEQYQNYQKNDSSNSSSIQIFADEDTHNMARVIVHVVFFGIVSICVLLFGQWSYSKWRKRIHTTVCDTEQLIVAIDLGTTLSGYAFSTTTTFKSDPLDMSLNKLWKSGNANLVSVKTPTSILLHSNGECLAFGYDAENEYLRLVIDKEDCNCLFFHRFKMELYMNEDITDKWEIKDFNGKSILAITVFSSALAKLKGYALDNIKEQDLQRLCDSILWVVTVPSIWTDKAKHFMRKSAEKAGMMKDRICIAFEPESVSVYFQYLYRYKPQMFPDSNGCDISQCKYLVIDIGGGTVQITSHNAEKGVITELCKPFGSNWGSTMIDTEFLNFISSIFGKNVLKSLKNKYIVNYFDILKNLEKMKSDVFSESPHAKPHVYFEYPHILEELYKEEYPNKTIEEAVLKSDHNKNVVVKDGRLCIPKDILQNMFKKVVEHVVNDINRVLSDSDSDEVDTFLIVGGFTLSPILKKHLTKAFRNIDIIIPEDSDMVVAKGAILSTQEPNIIASRIAQYTYGRQVRPFFDVNKHNPTKCVNIDGSERCNDVFEVLVNKGERVEGGKSIRREYETFEEGQGQKSIKIELFITKEDKVNYIDDSGCKPLCVVVVALPTTVNSGKRFIAVDFEFGNTEFKVTAFEKETNKLCEVTCSFRSM